MRRGAGSLAPCRRAVALALGCAVLWAPASAREAVEASAPQHLAVTIYRDPDRSEDETLDRYNPLGFAVITETRTVTLPPGESTIRFTGVAEGMVAVSAIVTGLPGGTIEKNRNADLLSPAALVDGTLGNRVTITRTNPATGGQESEQAVVRTRADGGLVLETEAGFEAVRCAGLPETLSFAHVPPGLSAQPVFTLDTRDPTGGTYTVQLSYIAWGFDWQAHYVATLEEGGRRKADTRLRLLSWLTLLNDNGQSFPDAELLVVAGRLNVESDFASLAEPPQARPLSLTCYPLGSTSAGSMPPPPPPAPPPPGIAPMAMDAAIVVTGARIAPKVMQSAAGMVAREEDVGDLKLYRVPEPVTVSAKSLKQVAFLQREEVRGRMLYTARCEPGTLEDAVQPATRLFATVNDKRHGLGVALPMGGISFFEPSDSGEQFVGEPRLRDHASGQDVEVELGPASSVFTQCRTTDTSPADGLATQITIGNAGRSPVTVRLTAGSPREWKLEGLKVSVKDGELVQEVTVPAGSRRTLRWSAMPVRP
ncbi:conserved hypothetical protein [Altererythrobacter sp. B11]|uniref:DUF4139 domain-containing protein n=1 Tax=Altererythrobacter sp. B11 TaxID=2060312 RepID=UPI000DC6DAB6|nr:hypothetical protein [Altererythrobacter sp. B11]BBC72610.1 conserved hypothetical protein [Altererythrobacter sp. B11]